MPDDMCTLLRGALDAISDAFAVYRTERDPAGSVIGLWLQTVNIAGAAWLGAPREELIGRELAELNPNSVPLGLWDLFAATAADGRTRRQRVEISRPATADQAEETAPLNVFEAVVTADGPDRIVVQFRDVSETAHGERLLAAAYEATAAVRATLQTALDATSDAFAVYELALDEQAHPTAALLVMINAAGAAPLDADPDELVGRDLRELFPAVEDSGLWQAVLDAVDAQATRTLRVHEHDPDGTWIATWANTIAPVAADRVVITWRDVTADERRERDLAAAHDHARHAATHDPLTGLANRALLTDHLRQALATPGERFAVAFLDLDGFKAINDTLGHDAGDEVLTAVADRLTRTLRGHDTVARLGGDEFVLLIRQLPEAFDQSGFIRRVQAAVEQPLLLPDTVLNPRTSIGLAVCPPEPPDLDGLLRTADERMYTDKSRHRHSRAPGSRTQASA